MVKTSFLAQTALFASSALAVTPMVVKGADFVNSVDDARFEIIGVAYQPGGSSGYTPGADALTDAEVCLRDAILLQRLGVNTIRVYNLDPEVDHSECASIFNAAGIYMVIDVNSPLDNEALNRVDPESSYNEGYLERVFKVIEAFSSFPNTLCYFSGNEVINEESVADAPGYIRAVNRDMKEYIEKHVDRSIPVGYSAADVRPLLAGTFNYFTCEIEDEPLTKIDFFGLNSYSWCGESSFTESGFDGLTEDFSNTTVPIFFSEYGCNKVMPRVWTEVLSLYGEDMIGVFSGGLVYEYSEEPNNYGLLEIGSNGDVELFEDYINLQNQLNKLDLKLLTTTNKTATSLDPPPCENRLLSSSNFTQNFEVPSRPRAIQGLIDDGVDGDYPSGLVDVGKTDMTHKVTGPDGKEITGLKLNILEDNASNLPGGESIGTDGSASGSDDDEDSAFRLVGQQYSAVIAAALAVGLLVHL